MAEAGVSIIGGHTIRDKEPKFGYTVMGLIHPDRVLDNTKARPGDAMILTKKIGTGVISTGVKAGICSDAVIEEFTLSMATLNKRTSEVMLEAGVSTATDVTGFGLIGHLNEVLSASKCRATLHAANVPFFEEALRLVAMNKIPGGTMANFRNYSPYVLYHESVTDNEKILINDAQTSGGLLIFVPGERKTNLVSALRKEGIIAEHIGDIAEGDAKSSIHITVER
jgi:selenide,water dikinase